jgi:hypothetical protein
MSERLNLTFEEFAEKYSVSLQTVLRLVNQNSLQTVRVDGILRVIDRWADPKTGTNSVEDVYILRGIEVAEILGITTRALRYLVSGGGKSGHMVVGGQLPYVQIGRQKRYCLADVRRLIAKRMERKAGMRKGPRVRAAIVQWALERLSTMKTLDPHKQSDYKPAGYWGERIKKKNESKRHAAISGNASSSSAAGPTRTESDKTSN